MSKAIRYVVGDGISLCHEGDTFNQREAEIIAKDIVTDEIDPGEIVTIYKLVPFKYVKMVESVVEILAK